MVGEVAEGWYGDPAGSYEFRWWNGQSWTATVSQNGQTAEDPFFDPEALNVHAPGESAEAGDADGGPRKRRAALVGAAALVIVVAAIAAFLLLGGDDPDEDLAVESAAAEEATSTTSSTVRETTTTTERVVRDPREVIGLSVGKAQEQLELAGFEVNTVETIDETADDGEVLDVVEEADGSITVSVARPPAIRFLETLEPVQSSRFTSGLVNLSGEPTPHSISASLGSCAPDTASVEYDLGRDFRVLRATLGLTDDSVAEDTAIMEIFLDGSPVEKHTLTFGEVIPLELDVTKALRLRIGVTLTPGQDFCGGGGRLTNVTTALGDAQLLGVPSEVPPESPS